MKIFPRLSASCLALAALVFALPASAYMKFTYTSPELPLTNALYDGEPWWDDYPFEVREPVSFSLSFTAAEQDLSRKAVTDFYMDDFDFTFNFVPSYDIFAYPMRVSPASYGRISLNRMGEIVGWNLIITITELITPDTDIERVHVADYWELIQSRGGAGTCNCDLLISRLNVHTWHGAWIQLAPIQFDYSNVNSADNWTVERVPVPEPMGFALLFTGLAGLFGLRRRVLSFNKGGL